MQETQQLRPTPDRVRETLFNWLMHDIASAKCLDLFAGTGILGLEALSRGATFVSFVEQEAQLTKKITERLESLGALADANVFCDDAMRWLDRHTASTRYDIIFLDPPYRLPIYPLLNKIAETMISTDDAILYVEQGAALQVDLLPAHWSVVKHQHNGQVHYHLIRCRR